MQFYANRQKKKKYNPASSLGMSPLGVIGWTVLMVSWSFVRPVTVDPLVRVRNGLMRGTKMTSEAGRDFLAFRAVPYAQPPVGSLRFQDPVAAQEWAGVFDATNDGPACPQLEGGLLRGSEDCLRLNIYTHDVSSLTKKRPVMVFVHGGGWTTGSGYGDTDVYGPEYFLDRDIVLVTINYRLHALGFLSTEDKEAPGNYGLLDQNMALQWVQQNIAALGGDPERVTLFGQSSGAGSVHSHVLSPRSSGLFQRAIAQSGTALCPWCIQKYVGKYTRRLAEHLKCPVEPSAELINCLRGKDAEDIVRFRVMTEIVDALPIGFGPRIDKERSEPFLPEDPVKILKSGSFNHVPFITGVNANEGAFAIARFINSGEKQMDILHNNPGMYIKYMAGIEFEKNALRNSLSVYQSYFGNKTVTDMKDFERLISDGLFFKCAVDTIDLHRRHGRAPLYTYLYAHSGQFSFPMMFMSDENSINLGVSHGDEILLEFAVPFLWGTPLPDEDIQTKDSLLDMWTSFALTGTPKLSHGGSMAWEPVRSDHMRYLQFKDGNVTMVNGNYPFVERLKNWKTISPSISLD